MKRYVIERHIAGVGSLSPAQLKALAASSNGAVATLAPQVQWIHSHIAADNTFCVYLGDSEATIREHSRLAGFPGKLGLDGSKVWEAYLAGRIDEIRRYCETDTLNTYLMFFRFQLMRGAVDRAEYDRELKLVRDTLGKSPEAHWREFLGRWT